MEQHQNFHPHMPPPQGPIQYACECLDRWTGQFCEKPDLTVRYVDSCEPNPCHHGGVCSFLPEYNAAAQREFKCECPEGWVGALCSRHSSSQAVLAGIGH